MCPNVDNIIVVHTTKRMKIITSIEKLFLQIQSINIVYSSVDNMIVVPIRKRMDIIMSIQVCLIS